MLRAFERSGNRYKAIDPRWIENLGLGLTIWHGAYFGINENWLRWCDQHGKVLLTGQERVEVVEQERDLVAMERDQATRERNQVTKERDKLREHLRALGVGPDA